MKSPDLHEEFRIPEMNGAQPTPQAPSPAPIVFNVSDAPKPTGEGAPSGVDPVTPPVIGHEESTPPAGETQTPSAMVDIPQPVGTESPAESAVVPAPRPSTEDASSILPQFNARTSGSTP